MGAAPYYEGILDPPPTPFRSHLFTPASGLLKNWVPFLKMTEILQAVHMANTFPFLSNLLLFVVVSQAYRPPKKTHQFSVKSSEHWPIIYLKIRVGSKSTTLHETKAVPESGWLENDISFWGPADVQRERVSPTLRDEQQLRYSKKWWWWAAFFEMDDFQGLLYVAFRKGISSFQIICAWYNL